MCVEVWLSRGRCVAHGVLNATSTLFIFRMKLDFNFFFAFFTGAGTNRLRQTHAAWVRCWRLLRKLPKCGMECLPCAWPHWWTTAGLMWRDIKSELTATAFKRDVKRCAAWPRDISRRFCFASVIFGLLCCFGFFGRVGELCEFCTRCFCFLY